MVDIILFDRELSWDAQSYTPNLSVQYTVKSEKLPTYFPLDRL